MNNTAWDAYVITSRCREGGAAVRFHTCKWQCEAWGLAEPTWRGLSHLQVSLAFFYSSSGPLSPEQQLVGRVCLDTVSVRVRWSNRTYRMHLFLSLCI